MEMPEFEANRPRAAGLRIQSPLDSATEQLVSEIINAAIEVHRELGPGHPEAAYERGLCIELSLRGIPYATQCPTRVEYKGHLVAQGKVDIIVAEKVVVEIKAIDALGKIHEGQLAAYLRATRLRVGLLINFNVEALKYGLKRLVN